MAMAWMTNDPEEAKILKAIDRAFTRECKACAKWPLELKVSRMTRAKEAKDAAYARVRERLFSAHEKNFYLDMTAGND